MTRPSACKSPALNMLINRRQALGLLGAGAVFGLSPLRPVLRAAQPDASAHHWLDLELDMQVLIRWGDPIMVDTPAFAPLAQTYQAQERQFGFNCDYLAYLPLSDDPNHGLLWVNHEYTLPKDMFPGAPSKAKTGPEEILIQQMAHGGSIVEIRQINGQWQVQFGPYNRRITAQTPCLLSGPVAGHDRVQTIQDPTGRTVWGMLGNCAGGITPWGTILSAEENIDYYFDGPLPPDEARNYARLGIGSKKSMNWQGLDRRFDMARVKTEANRFGWIVEIDPLAPDQPPIKRTALGRFKHECATSAIGADGRLAVYSGDDEAGEYLYRFVSHDKINADPALNRDLLDHGTLYVARFDETGLDWLELSFGNGPLTPKNGFHSLADILIETRRAADLLGATPMDRPEDVEVHPDTGRIYVMLSNNRQEKSPNPANPDKINLHGHILEITPPLRDGKPDHGASRMEWDILLKGGPDGSGRVWLSSPDNGAIRGNQLFIATDQGGSQKKNAIADGLYVCPLSGPDRGQLRLLFAVPIGAEATGPCFSPDGKTLFLSVQHPAEGSGFDSPSTRWPDFDPNLPPRPSVIALKRKDGKAF